MLANVTAVPNLGGKIKINGAKFSCSSIFGPAGPLSNLLLATIQPSSIASEY